MRKGTIIDGLCQRILKRPCGHRGVHMTYETVGVSANYIIRDVWHNQWKSGWSGFLLDAATNSFDKDTSVIRFDTVAFTRVVAFNRLSLSLSLSLSSFSPNPFTFHNCCNIISSQPSFRLRSNLSYLYWVNSFGFQSDSYVIKRNRPLLTYLCINTSVSWLPVIAIKKFARFASSVTRKKFRVQLILRAELFN